MIPKRVRLKWFLRENKKTIITSLLIIAISLGIVNYYRNHAPRKVDDVTIRQQDKIATIGIKGTITGFGEAKVLRKILKDSSIKAAVLEINSGGGYVAPCFELENAVSQLAQEKPVIAYVEEICCSGAYLAASAADKIIAHRYSYTSGLGVISRWVSYKDYLENRGIEYFVWKSGDRKDSYARYRDPAENEKEAIQEHVENLAEELYLKIENNRENAILNDRVRSGDVLYGHEARKLNLVDNYGSHSSAVSLAARIANLESYKLIKIGGGECSV